MNNRTALLVIDMQVCNFEVEPPVYEGSELLSKIGTLVIQAHSANVPLFYIQHCGPQGAIDQPGTTGWEIHPAVAPLEGDVVVQKRHPDAFQDTNLQRELKSKDVEKLIITGIQTEYCVDTTCRRAYSLGFEVTLVVDAHSTWDTDLLTSPQIITHHNKVLGGWFVILKSAKEINF
ncbi:MAG: cysteine hydrolase family protein [Anaerolineales bacterium]|jgi:nicotinamidase-related amidase